MKRIAKIVLISLSWFTFFLLGMTFRGVSAIRDYNNLVSKYNNLVKGHTRQACLEQIKQQPSLRQSPLDLMNEIQQYELNKEMLKYYRNQNWPKPIIGK